MSSQCEEGARDGIDIWYMGTIVGKCDWQYENSLKVLFWVGQTIQLPTYQHKNFQVLYFSNYPHVENI